MTNIMHIAKKDISDIIGNISIGFVLITYLLLILASALNVYDMAATGNLYGSPVLDVMLGWVSNAIMTYGSIVAMMVGFSAISNEKKDNALNTLVTKPLYRDTIINGKMLSCTVFMIFIFGMATILYTSLLLIVCGNIVGPVLDEYLSRLPFVFLMSSLVAIAYMSISFLVPIWVKRHGVALLFTVIVFMMLKSVIPTVSFAGNVYILTGNGEIYNWIMRLSPDTAYTRLILTGLYDPATGVFQIIYACWTDIVSLLLFIIIIMSLCYASFIRRDIA
jgi:ABC-2 type transport system permease protein